jgi:hypothetical protein
MSKQSIDTDVNKVDQRTAPPGMAPDSAHAPRKTPGISRETEQEETFDSSKSNAGSHQTGHLK